MTGAEDIDRLMLSSWFIFCPLHVFSSQFSVTLSIRVSASKSRWFYHIFLLVWSVRWYWTYIFFYPSSDWYHFKTDLFSIFNSFPIMTEERREVRAGGRQSSQDTTDGCPDLVTDTNNVVMMMTSDSDTGQRKPGFCLLLKTWTIYYITLTFALLAIFRWWMNKVFASQCFSFIWDCNTQYLAQDKL